jgi:general secretion pathway protein G
MIPIRRAPARSRFRGSAAAWAARWALVRRAVAQGAEARGPLAEGGRESVRSSREGRFCRSAARLPGFTLIEVLVVLVILALLAGIVTTQLLAPAEEAKADASKIQIKALMSALDLYRLHNSTYPTTDQGLSALLRKPEVGIVPETWRGPYLNSNNLPVDGWKRPFIYTSDGRVYLIVSLGADGAEGGTGLNADLRSSDL